jgi:hypothetical protein
MHVEDAPNGCTRKGGSRELSCGRRFRGECLSALVLQSRNTLRELAPCCSQAACRFPSFRSRVSITHVPFLGRRTEEYGPSDLQSTDARDRAVRSNSHSNTSRKHENPFAIPLRIRAALSRARFACFWAQPKNACNRRQSPVILYVAETLSALFELRRLVNTDLQAQSG